jgi:hypothetical protein
MGNFQKYWSQNVGQDFIVLDFFVGGISCGRKRSVREINVSRAWDPVHAGDKALTRETPAKRGRVNRYVHLLHHPLDSKVCHGICMTHMTWLTIHCLTMLTLVRVYNSCIAWDIHGHLFCLVYNREQSTTVKHVYNRTSLGLSFVDWIDSCFVYLMFSLYIILVY